MVDMINVYDNVADDYTSRPTYPEKVFEFLRNESSRHDIAWDCGCGGGQATFSLAKYFSRVIATDVSSQQLKSASGNPRVKFRQRPAESSGLDNSSIDLVTSFMAAHWFNLPRFFDEAKRVGKPSALIAIFAYAEPFVEDDAMNRLLKEFSSRIHPFGGPNIQMMRDGYRNLFFPFEREISVPPMYLTSRMTMSNFIRYMRSRASVMDYTKNVDAMAVYNLQYSLGKYWNDTQIIEVRWPLFGRVAKMHY